MEYYFNANLKNIPPSASLAVSEKARELKKKGIDGFPATASRFC